MTIALWILGGVFLYALLGGVTKSLTKLFIRDEDARFFASVLWPIGLPWAIAWIVGNRVTEYGTDYLEAQKQKRQEKRYRIAEERRAQEREIERHMAELDEEEGEGRFCVRQQAGR